MSRKARIGMIDRGRPKPSVSRQCKLVGVSRSSLYYRPVGASLKDSDLMAKMDRQYLKTPFYGFRRMGVWLRSQGHNVNRKRVRRLMHLMGLETVYRRPNTSRPSPEHRIYPYLLRGLSVTTANQVWVADITYIPMARGFLYLVAIMDHFSRHVLSWRLSNTLDVDFCVEALEEALSRAKPEIFNTDQGGQFTSDAFTGMLLEQGIQISMDGKGRYLDNILVERLWRTVKYEEVYLRAYESVREARVRIDAYMRFYNNERPHQSLGYRTPAQTYNEAQDQLSITAAADSLNSALLLSN